VIHEQRSSALRDPNRIARRSEKNIKVRLRVTRGKEPHTPLESGPIISCNGERSTRPDDRGRKALSLFSRHDAIKNDAIRCAAGSRAPGCDAVYALASFEVRDREAVLESAKPVDR
jgi:hypothetical protein